MRLREVKHHRYQSFASIIFQSLLHLSSLCEVDLVMSSQYCIWYNKVKLHNIYTQVYNTKHSNPTCPKKVCTWTAQNQFTQVIMEVGNINFVLIFLLAGFMRLNTSSRCSGIERVRLVCQKFLHSTPNLLVFSLSGHFWHRFTLFLQIHIIGREDKGIISYMLGRQTLRIIHACALNLRNTQVAFITLTLLSFHSHNVILCICNKQHTQLN